MNSRFAGAVSAVSLSLNTVPCSFKVGGEFGVQTSYEHGHKLSAPSPAPLVFLDQSHLTFRQRDISVPTEKIKAARDLWPKQGFEILYVFEVRFP